MNEQLLQTGEVLKLAPEITERQLTYWRMIGVVVPALPANGSGVYVGWSQRDVARLRAIGALMGDLVPFVCPQISHLMVAAIWAGLENDDVWDHWLGGVRLHVELAP